MSNEQYKRKGKVKVMHGRGGSRILHEIDGIPTVYTTKQWADKLAKDEANFNKQKVEEKETVVKDIKKEIEVQKKEVATLKPKKKVKKKVATKPKEE